MQGGSYGFKRSGKPAGCRSFNGKQRSGAGIEQCIFVGYDESYVAYSNDKSILITALYNPQVLRTADLMGISCVIFIGRSEPDPALIKLAESLGVTVVQSPYSMYVTCGILFSNGLQGAFQNEQER